MTTYIEYELEDGTTVLIESSEPETGVVRASTKGIFSKCRGVPLWSPNWAGTRHCPYPGLLRGYHQGRYQDRAGKKTFEETLR